MKSKEAREVLRNVNGEFRSILGQVRLTRKPETVFSDSPTVMNSQKSPDYSVIINQKIGCKMRREYKKVIVFFVYHAFSWSYLA
jgi:hypothetical protein